MVRPKTKTPDLEATKQQMRKIKEDIEARTIAFRWYVIEHTPARENEIGGYIPPKSVVVSKFFPSEEDAICWMQNHEADEGKTLKISRQRLVKTEVWMQG